MLSFIVGKFDIIFFVSFINEDVSVYWGIFEIFVFSDLLIWESFLLSILVFDTISFSNLFFISLSLLLILILLLLFSFGLALLILFSIFFSFSLKLLLLFDFLMFLFWLLSLLIILLFFSNFDSIFWLMNEFTFSINLFLRFFSFPYIFLNKFNNKLFLMIFSSLSLGYTTSNNPFILSNVFNLPLLTVQLWYWGISFIEFLFNIFNRSLNSSSVKKFLISFNCDKISSWFKLSERVSIASYIFWSFRYFIAELYWKFSFDFNGNKKFSASSQFPSIINFLKNDNSLLYVKILNLVSFSIVINESI